MRQVGTIDVVLYAKEHWPGTSFALTLGESVGGGKQISPSVLKLTTLLYSPSTHRHRHLQ